MHSCRLIMRHLLLLAASTVALSLGRTADISEQDCKSVKHQGNWEIYMSTEGTSKFETEYGWVCKADTGDGLTRSAGRSSSAFANLQFVGCQGGDPFHLYCLNCGSSTGFDLIASKNMSLDAHGEPDHWFLYNSGPVDSPSAGELKVANVTRIGGSISSDLFTWDLDGTFIRPVTYNNDLSLQPYLFAVATSKGEFEFTPSAGENKTPAYALWWRGT